MEFHIEYAVIAVFYGSIVIVGIVLFISASGDLFADRTSDDNTNGTAIESFVDMIAYAKHSLVIHDDGNHFEDSIYQSESVLRALRDQLTSNPKLQIRVLFDTIDKDLEFYNLAT